MIVAGTPSGELASSLLTNNCLILLKGLDCLILYSPFKPLIRTPLRGVVGFFGFHHDQKLALWALAVSAAKMNSFRLYWVCLVAATNAVRHWLLDSVVLMSYHGVVLLLSGYQADEAQTIKQYWAIVNKSIVPSFLFYWLWFMYGFSTEARYPMGALWILNRVRGPFNQSIKSWLQLHCSPGTNSTHVKWPWRGYSRTPRKPQTR